MTHAQIRTDPIRYAQIRTDTHVTREHVLRYRTARRRRHLQCATPKPLMHAPRLTSRLHFALGGSKVQIRAGRWGLRPRLAAWVLGPGPRCIIDKLALWQGERYSCTYVHE